MAKNKDIHNEGARARSGANTNKGARKWAAGANAKDKRTHWEKKTWGMVVVLSAIASLTGFLTLKPDLAIGAPRYLDEADPFSARFDVVNHNSLFPMNDVQIICGLNRVVTDRNIVFDRSMATDKNYHYDSISSGETATVPCPLRSVVRVPGRVTCANVTLWVEYTWPFWPKKLSAGQVFVVERDAEGNLKWSARPFSSKIG